MLKDIIVIFIMAIPGKPDLYATMAYSPTAISCDQVEKLERSKYAWAMNTMQSRPQLQSAGIQPQDIKVLCMEVDHVDPDTIGD